GRGTVPAAVGHSAYLTGAQRDVVEVAVGSGRQVDRNIRSGDERNDLAGARQPVGAALHGPDASAGAVGEEQRTGVGGRVVAVGFERDAADRRVAGRAAVAGHDVVVVVVGVVGRLLAGGVQRLAQVQVRPVVSGLPLDPLVARPAEVLHGAVGGVRDAVDLLPLVPADVANPQFTGAGPEGEAELVAHAVGDHAAFDLVRAARVRIAGHRLAGARIDADDRAVERDRLACRPPDGL